MTNLGHGKHAKIKDGMFYFGDIRPQRQCEIQILHIEKE
jgi:hypothetical protein